jgi:hypothetical protein
MTCVGLQRHKKLLKILLVLTYVTIHTHMQVQREKTNSCHLLTRRYKHFFSRLNFGEMFSKVGLLFRFVDPKM